MANYNTLKTSVSDVIKTNGNQEITGAILQQTLLAIINSIGADYQFAGVAYPNTNPGTPDQNVAYLATTPGVYTYFGGFTLLRSQVAVIKGTGETWIKEDTLIDGKDPSIFSIHGFYGASNGNFNPHESWRCTPKLRFSGSIVAKCYLATSGNQGVVFFDENGAYISAYYGGTAGFQNFEVPAASIPANAVFISLVTLATNVADSWAAFGIEQAYAQAFDALKLVVESNKAITDRFKNFGKELFSESGYYDVRNGTKMTSTAVHTTPLLKIAGDIWAVSYMGGASYPQYGICYFDENQNYISGSAGTTAGLQTTHVPVADIPNNAVYFAISTLNANLPDASLVCGWTGALYDIFLQINGVPERVTELENEMNYSDGVAGLAFNNTDGHNLAKQAIKAVWLTYGPSLPASERAAADALRATLANTKFYITDLYNVSGTYGCFLQIKDAVTGGSNCFSQYVAGIHTITGPEEIWDLIARTGTPVYPSGFTAGPFAIHFAIDWNVLNNKRVTTSGDNPIEITFGQVAFGSRVDTMTLKEKVQSMDAANVAIASINLTGKKIVCLGDSLTEIVDSNYKHYSDYIAERTGATMINCGFGGTQLRQRVEPVADFNSLPESTEAEITTKSRYAYALIDIINLVKAITSNNFTEQTKAVNWLANHGDDNRAILTRLTAIDWSTVDGVTIFAGTNDWPSYKPTIGTPGSTDINYTLGAINEIIRLLLSTYKQLKLYWFTPVVRWIDYTGGAGVPEKWSDVLEYNQDNGTLREFSAAIENEVKTNHIPVCDLYNTLGWNKSNFSQYFPANDGTHPQTIAGLSFLGKKIGAFILANNTL